MSIVGRGLVNIAYVLFLGLYVYAAADYGLTRTSHVTSFACALGVTVGIWLLGYMLQGRLPNIGLWPVILTGAILIFGWFITALGWISNTLPDDQLLQWTGTTLSNWIFLWGSYDVEASVKAMIRTSALLASMLMAIDFWRHPAKARGLVLTIILSSFGMVLFFFCQKIVGPPFALRSEDGTTFLSFGTYRYHGNAASYLNLCWPISAAVAIFAMVRQSTLWPVWLFPTAITLLATFFNISKAGNVLTFVGLAILLGVLSHHIFREIRHSRIKISKSMILVTLIPLLVILGSIPFALPLDRWDYLTKASGGRVVAYSELVKMVPAAGWGGFGPGTFATFSMGYTKKNALLKNFWYDYAHEDYLQTLIEWGVIGTCLWGLLLFPSFIFLYQATRTNSQWGSREFAGYRLGIFDYIRSFFKTLPNSREAALAGGALTAMILTAIHSTFDFPLQIASLQFYFLTFVALGWSSHRRVKPVLEKS